MIWGIFSYGKTGDNKSIAEDVSRFSASGSLTSVKITSDAFEGGFCLHPGLPLRESDFYFSDKAEAIEVLMWGSFYNSDDFTEVLPGRKPAGPELAAKLFSLEGPGFVNKMNGDFAIFICNTLKREAWLFRDHLGIKPLAYFYSGNSVCFSSDIVALSRAAGREKPVEKDFLLTWFRFSDRTKTPFSKVMKLMPGSYLHFSAEGTANIRYWDPSEFVTDKRLTLKNISSTLEYLVKDSVKIRCDSRFIPGAHISGGLDSGVTALLAASEYAGGVPLTGFSWSPVDYRPVNAGYDERELAKEIEDKAGIRLFFVAASPEEFKHLVENYYYNRGFFAEDKTTDIAAGMGVNLLFSGWGGDEFISTGHRGVDIDLLRSFRIKKYLHRNPLRPFRKFIWSMMYFVVRPLLGILDRDTANSFRDDTRYLKRAYRKPARRWVRDFYFHASRRQMHLRLLNFYHLQERCEAWAVMAYRKGIEYRYPLLDKRIVETVLKMPSELLAETNHFRPLLREIGRDILPEKTRWQLHKTDPVYREYMNKLEDQALQFFASETEEWKTNPDLDFIDFDRLETDLVKAEKGGHSINMRALCRTLIYIKGVHEFLRKYREKG